MTEHNKVIEEHRPKKEAENKRQRAASHDMAMALTHVRASQIGSVIVGGEIVDPGSGHFDVVAMSDDGKTIIFYEAKGGYHKDESEALPTLGSRNVEAGFRAEQGTPEYLLSIARIDERLLDWFDHHPHVLDGLRSGDITVEYKLVHANTSGGMRIWDFNMTGLDHNLWWGVGTSA